MPENEKDTYHAFDYVLTDFTFPQLSNSFILRHSAERVNDDMRGFYDIHPQTIGINYALFTGLSGSTAPEWVEVKYLQHTLTLSCACNEPKRKLCAHQAQVLMNMLQRNELRIFFDRSLRHQKIKETARDYGLENETDLDDFFQVEYSHKSVEIKPALKELLPFNQSNSSYLEENLLPKKTAPLPPKENTKTVLVFGKHRYYDFLNIELYQAETTQNGKLKNPLQPLNPFDFIWNAENNDELKFYTAVSRFQNNNSTEKPGIDMEGLKALVKNPLNLAVYYHDNEVSPNIISGSLIRTGLKTAHTDIRLSVELKNNFYEVQGMLMLNDALHELKTLNLKYQYFIFLHETLYLIEDADLLRVITFFKKHNGKVLIHSSKFEAFRKNILSRLEDKIRITYADVKPATPVQLQENGFTNAQERIIYLYDLEHYVEINPVMRYGEVEIQVLSKRQIYATDTQGNEFMVQRDDDAELRFTTLLLRQHPDFYEQLDGQFFYLHKKRFMEEDWFLNVFEEWRSQGITILGFNEIKNNKLNQHKATVSISVTSGINWFDTAVAVSFGKQKVSLKHLHKTIRNKSRFIMLDDGTQGILPAEWVEKISKYLEWGDIAGEFIRTPKINFASITELYEEEVLSTEVKRELAFFNAKIYHYGGIEKVEQPEGLTAVLRSYQQQGLDWLNFLDEFGFGACLADDMGLGKTVQVIALLLLQRKKQRQNASLVVVPTTLIFNWQEEVKKFAPSLKIFTLYGAGRIKEVKDFDKYEIILTSYGTLQSDISFLKEYLFNYIILDESQAIKNPGSQRYKTVRLLKSRNKIVMTGTPVENNTFDLYGQLSFACPGLLGNKQYFRDIYSTPIDKFKNSKRAIELQQKISPFILRRTKEQVARELPEKTEMITYCQMEDEQRKIYDEYEKEFREYVSEQEDEDIKKNSMYVLQGLLKLRQICNAPALLKEERFRDVPSAKIETLLNEIDNKSPHHKILIFSQFVSMLDLISDKLTEKNIAFEYLSGKTKNRSDKVEAFQNNEAVRIFLISLKAGGTGLNLTEADYVYLVDPWWNPAVENQAIDRSYRIGQKKNVVAVRLICPGTVEAKIVKLQETKKELAKGLIKTGDDLFESFSKEDLMRLLD